MTRAKGISFILRILSKNWSHLNRQIFHIAKESLAVVPPKKKMMVDIHKHTCYTPENEHADCCKIPMFCMGSTSARSWWIFQPAMLVFRQGTVPKKTSCDFWDTLGIWSSTNNSNNFRLGVCGLDLAGLTKALGFKANPVVEDPAISNPSQGCWINKSLHCNESLCQSLGSAAKHGSNVAQDCE